MQEIQLIGCENKLVVLYKEHTFSFQGRKEVKRYLYCSKRISSKCSARVKLDKFGYITEEDTDHNHPPPVLKQMESGKYLKI